MTPNGDTSMKRLGYRPPLDVAEPDELVLVDYVSDGRVADHHPEPAARRQCGHNGVGSAADRGTRNDRRTLFGACGDHHLAPVTEPSPSGGDLYQRNQMTKEQWLRQRQVFDRVLYTLRQLRRPIIAAVHGMAYGGGNEIAISCDFIIASDDAVFGQPEAMVGLSAGGGSPAIPAACSSSPGRAMQMPLMTGEPITAQEAHRLGMVDEVHPRSELMDAVLAIAERIADNSPTAVQSVKRAVKMGQGEPVEQAVEIMMDEHWRSVVHPDRIEGIAAFTEGREPTYPDPDF